VRGPSTSARTGHAIPPRASCSCMRTTPGRSRTHASVTSPPSPTVRPSSAPSATYCVASAASARTCCVDWPGRRSELNGDVDPPALETRLDHPASVHLAGAERARQPQGDVEVAMIDGGRASTVTVGRPRLPRFGESRHAAKSRNRGDREGVIPAIMGEISCSVNMLRLTRRDPAARLRGERARVAHHTHRRRGMRARRSRSDPVGARHTGCTPLLGVVTVAVARFSGNPGPRASIGVSIAARWLAVYVFWSFAGGWR